MKRSSKAQRKRNRDYWARQKRSRPREQKVSEPEKLTRSEPVPQQGLRLPSPQGKLLLMEAEDGTLVDVPEEKLDDWIQGQEAEPQGLSEKEGMLLDKVLEMLYGGVDAKQ